jgi:hypothetical protein
MGVDNREDEMDDDDRYCNCHHTFYLWLRNISQCI